MSGETRHKAPWQRIPKPFSASPANESSKEETQDINVDMSGGHLRLPPCTPLHTARMDPPPPQEIPLAPLSVTDMRQQILANAMVLFPHIVHSHNNSFPSVLSRAEDIFEISVTLRHDFEPSDFVARLTRRHELAPAFHVLMLGGAPRITLSSALCDLLEAICNMLGTDQAVIIGRPPQGPVLRPVLHGSHEGDRTLEMQRAKTCIAELKELIRSKLEAAAAAAAGNGRRGFSFRGRGRGK